MRNSYLILLIWLGIGILLRFTALEIKSPWTDEFSTIVFSLGNSFRNVPLDQVIPLDVLMQPIVPNPNAGIADVTEHLLSESNHPPLYFLLAHFWMKWFPLDRFDLLWVARSFAAILGAVSIPAIYGLGYLGFRSRLIGNLAAAMMAVSPYGIFLAQEARHYTLAILFVIASLCCLVIYVQRIQAEKLLPFWLSIIWVIVNTLGIASHYFFVFALLAEAIVIIIFWWLNHKLANNRIKSLTHNSGFRNFMATVIIGTIAGGIVWLPVLYYSYNSQLTAWIRDSDRIGFEWISPIFQALAAWITMLSLLPIEVTELPIVIAAGLLMLIFYVWATPILIRGIKVLLIKPTTRLPVLLFGSFVLASIALFFSITYLFGIDLTRGARYNFVYFPAVIVLIGASLTVCRSNLDQNSKLIKFSTNYPVIIILLMGFLSSLTVAFNLGYQKYYRPDLLVPVIEKYSANPALIATIHKTHVQTGEMMGLGWEFQRLVGDSAKPQFLLAHQERKNTNLPTRTLSENLAEMPRPFDLWLVNFPVFNEVKEQNCLANSESLPFVDGYNYHLYHCLAEDRS